MKKDRSYLMIKICFIMIMISFVTFYGTHAFFVDSEELSASINITTGTLDIQLQDITRNTVGDQSYILNLNQTNNPQIISNLSVQDIGSLSSNLSARVITNKPDVVNLLQISLVDSIGNEERLNQSYKLVNSIHNTGKTFGVKIFYTGALPINYSDLEVSIEFRATQPNDVSENPKMFTDKQEIRFVMPQNIQIAFEDGQPIKGTVIVEHNTKIEIKLLPLELNISNVVITFRDNKFFDAIYDKANRKIVISSKGNNNSDIINIYITLSSGEIYHLKHDILSTN